MPALSPLLLLVLALLASNAFAAAPGERTFRCTERESPFRPAADNAPLYMLTLNTTNQTGKLHRVNLANRTRTLVCQGTDLHKERSAGAISGLPQLDYQFTCSVGGHTVVVIAEDIDQPAELFGRPDVYAVYVHNLNNDQGRTLLTCALRQ